MTAGISNVAIWPKHTASDQTCDDVTNHAEVKSWRRLSCTNAAQRTGDEIDQNLFHMGLFDVPEDATDGVAPVWGNRGHGPCNGFSEGGLQDLRRHHRCQPWAIEPKAQLSVG